jgi:hypothetical protein
LEGVEKFTRRLYVMKIKMETHNEILLKYAILQAIGWVALFLFFALHDWFMEGNPEDDNED